MELQKIKGAVIKFIQDEDGLTVVEYAVAGGLISLAVVLSFTNLGAAVKTVIDNLTTAISPAPAG